MRAPSWMTCVWPGLTALWERGSWRGLTVAVAFAGVLNFALLATFTTGQIPAASWPLIPGAAWVLVLSFWVANFALANRKSAAGQPQPESLFREAQTEYLKGHWIEAETLLARLLAQNPDDVEARLMRAMVERRTGRFPAARATLIELCQLESSSRWRLEIETELARLAARESAPATSPSPGGELPPSLSKAA